MEGQAALPLPPGVGEGLGLGQQEALALNHTPQDEVSGTQLGEANLSTTPSIFHSVAR